MAHPFTNLLRMGHFFEKFSGYDTPIDPVRSVDRLIQNTPPSNRKENYIMKKMLELVLAVFGWSLYPNMSNVREMI